MFDACVRGRRQSLQIVAVTADHCTMGFHNGMLGPRNSFGPFSQSVSAAMAGPWLKASSFHCHVSGSAGPLEPPVLAHARPEGVAHGSEIVEVVRIHVEQHGDGGHDPRSMADCEQRGGRRIIGMFGDNASYGLGATLAGMPAAFDAMLGFASGVGTP